MTGLGKLNTEKNLSYGRLQNNGLLFKGQEKKKLNAKFGCYLLGVNKLH